MFNFRNVLPIVDGALSENLGGKITPHDRATVLRQIADEMLTYEHECVKKKAITELNKKEAETRKFIEELIHAN